MDCKAKVVERIFQFVEATHELRGDLFRGPRHAAVKREAEPQVHRVTRQEPGNENNAVDARKRAETTSG